MLDEFDSISPSSEFLKSPHLKSRIPTYSFHLSSSTFGRKKCVSLKKTAWKVTPKTRYSYKRGTFISSVVCCLGVASEVLDLRRKVTKSDMIISKPHHPIVKKQEWRMTFCVDKGYHWKPWVTQLWLVQFAVLLSNSLGPFNYSIDSTGIPKELLFTKQVDASRWPPMKQNKTIPLRPLAQSQRKTGQLRILSAEIRFIHHHLLDGQTF